MTQTHNYFDVFGSAAVQCMKLLCTHISRYNPLRNLQRALLKATMLVARKASDCLNMSYENC